MDTLITAFLSGFFLATAILWAIHRKQQQDWQKEYRRLMGGIHFARTNVINLNVTRGSIAEYLGKIFNGEI